MNKYFENIKLKHIFILGVFFHLIAVIFTEGFHRPDEHLGIFRFAAFKLGFFPKAELSWEYPAQIRPWLHPYLYVYLIKFLNFFNIVNPFTYATFFRFISSLCALTSTYFFYKAYSKDFQGKDREFNTKILWSSALLLWFLPFFHARSSAENWGASMFIFGLALLYPLLNLKKQELRKSFAIGLLFGASFIFRFQMSIMIFFLMLWMLLFKRQTLCSLISITFGIICFVIFSTYLDYLGYGTWTFSPYNYVYQNIFKGVASGFGVSPWYYYITKTFSKSAPPLSLFIILGYFLYWYRNKLSLFTWITLPYLVIHSLLGHKELRFIFVMGSFFPIILIELSSFLKNSKFAYKKWFKFLVIIALVQNMLMLTISSIKPAYGPISMYHFFYNNQFALKKIYTLGLFRDQLKFYLKAPIEQIREEDRDKIKHLLDQNNRLTHWFLTDKFADKAMFEAHSCSLFYSSYPTWLFKFNYFNWMKRSKIWSIYHCPVTKPATQL